MPRKKNEEEAKQIHVVVDPITHKKLLEIKKETGAGTMIDVIRRAIHVYHYFSVVEMPKGSAFYVRDKHGRENKIIFLGE